MRILLLTRYGTLGASSRLRSNQYIPFLSSHGLEIREFPLFDNSFLSKLYQNKNINYISNISSYIRRIYLILTAKSYNLLWIEKELFPFLPSIAEKILTYCKIPIIVDYDDALFHRYDQHKNIIIRKFLKGKIDKVMSYSAVVIAGNQYIAQRAFQAGAKKVELLPTVIDLDKYKINYKKTDPRFTIGWIGTPFTTQYLKLISPAIKQMQEENKIRILIIGASDFKIEGIQFDYLEWSEDTEVESLNQIDIGIMPLTEDKWALGKCGYKLIQYMACKKPVIASPIGTNNTIVENNVNGFLANSQEEWKNKIEYFYSNPDQVERMGKLAYDLVKKKYSIQVTAPKLLRIILDASGQN